MREWNDLLDYIDSYVYDYESEEILIRNSQSALMAVEFYQKTIKEYAMDEDANLKWAFDIALDCVRRMNEENRKHLTHSYSVDFLGYGMFIRNQYIHVSNNHEFYDADWQCSKVLELIYTILHKYYNCFNKELCDLLKDFTYQDIVHIYGDKFEFIEEYTLKLTDKNCAETADSILNKIIKRIRRELGANGFKEILVEVVNECGKDCLAPDKWLNFINKLYGKAPTYLKEYHQVIALKEIGLISQLICDYSGEIKSKEDCKTFIDKNLGLREEDAANMAECLWYAFKENFDKSDKKSSDED